MIVGFFSIFFVLLYKIELFSVRQRQTMEESCMPVVFIAKQENCRCDAQECLHLLLESGMNDKSELFWSTVRLQIFDVTHHSLINTLFVQTLKKEQVKGKKSFFN